MDLDHIEEKISKDEIRRIIYRKKNLNLYYALSLSITKDMINFTGYVGSNLLVKNYKQVEVDKVRELLKSGTKFIDVIEKVEYERRYIKGVKNIPFSKIRENILIKYNFN